METDLLMKVLRAVALACALRPAAGWTTARPPRRVSARASGVYGEPELYDLAFSYRDFDSEVDFLLEAHARHGATGGAPRAVLELAAGPARHLLNAWARAPRRAEGAEGTLDYPPLTALAALDASAPMKEYALRLAADAGAPLEYHVGAMEDFALDARGFDAAWLLLGSAGHLLTADAFVAMLRACAAHLADGGTLTVELPHPREVFRVDDVTAEGWDVPDGPGNPLGIGEAAGRDGFLAVEWGTPAAPPDADADGGGRGDDDGDGDDDGADGDDFDPVTQIRTARVDLRLEAADGRVVQRVREALPQRAYTLCELELLVALSGVFAPPTFYGAMSPDFVAVDDEDEAFRMVAVMRRL